MGANNIKNTKYNTLIRAHKHASNNSNEIKNSKLCYCFYCLKSFEPNTIKEWIDNECTAICPYCGIDSVIGDAAKITLDEDFLKKMYDYWFEC